MEDKILHKPIFVVGHARGGSTLLGAIINAHSHVGPKHIDKREFDSESFRDFKTHLEFSERLEQKDIWFKYFKGKDCFTHMGKEIYEDSLSLTNEEIKELKRELTQDFNEKRFLSKTPTNSFRLNPIKEMFPDAKIVIILRKGEEVVASWGQRAYGFGKDVNWGKTRIKKLSYYKGINIFSEKWEEVIDCIEASMEKNDVLLITYDDLVLRTQPTLERVFDFLELPIESYLKDIKLNKEGEKWKSSIPKPYQYYLKYRVSRGLRKMVRMGANFK